MSCIISNPCRSVRAVERMDRMAATAHRCAIIPGEACMQIRSSYGMFIPRYQDEVIAAVEERVASWLNVPVINQEGIQVSPTTDCGPAVKPTRLKALVTSDMPPASPSVRCAGSAVLSRPKVQAAHGRTWPHGDHPHLPQRYADSHIPPCSCPLGSGASVQPVPRWLWARPAWRKPCWLRS